MRDLLWTLWLATTVAVAGARLARAEVVVLVGDPAGRVAKDPDPARMNEPFAIAFDAERRMYGVEYTRGNRLFRVAADGTIYLALREGNALVEIKGGSVRTVVNAAGTSGYSGDGGPGREALLAGPKYVSLDRCGRVLIADTENHCIRRYDPATGIITTVAGIPTKMAAGVGADLRSTHLARPHGCTIAPDGRLVIADSDNDRILAGPLAE